MINLVVGKSDENLFGGGEVEIYPFSDSGICGKTAGTRGSTICDVKGPFVFEDGSDLSFPREPVVVVSAQLVVLREWRDGNRSVGWMGVTDDGRRGGGRW